MPNTSNVTSSQLARFKRLVAVQKNECWMWTGQISTGGYGMFKPSAGVEREMAHRWSYRIFVDQIPTGLQIDHKCHTEDLSCPGGLDCEHRRCVNPAHLEPVTGSENTLRQRHYERSVTHCPQGHPYEGENLIVNGDGKRRCRICIAERKRVSRLRESGGTTTTGG